MGEQHNCPICEEKVTVDPYEAGYKLNCVRCGRFSITSAALPTLSTDENLGRANLSGWIRENQGYQITKDNLYSLAQLKTPSVGSKGKKLLLWLARISPKAGAKFDVVVESYK